MKKIQHIVVGVDFSIACRAALKTALRLASFAGTPVTVVHAMDPSVAEEVKLAYNYSEVQLKESIRGRVKEFLEQVDAATALVEIEVAVEHPLLALIQACERCHADLLVLGTRGNEHGPNQVGPVAAKCVRKAPVDVLLVREDVKGPFRKVMACVDFSEHSAKALQFGAYLAERDGAELDNVFVCQSPMMLSLDYAGFLPTVPVEENLVLQESQKRLGEFVEQMLPTGEAWGLIRNEVLEHVSIREALIGHIVDNKADLIVLGTRGKTDLRTLLVGTTAESVVKHAPCSILAVKLNGHAWEAAAGE